MGTEDTGAARALARLQQDDSVWESLVALGVREALDTPLRDLIDPPSLGEVLAAAIRDAASLSGASEGQRPADVDAWVAARLADDRPLGDLLPPHHADLAHPLLAVRWTPSEAFVLQLLKHDAARSLIRETLSNSLHTFATRARSLDDGVLGGLGGRAFKRGKGLLGQVGSAAEGLVGAVSKEVEHALEGRIKEFLQGATDEALRGIAAWVADPAHDQPLAELRRSVYDQVTAAPARDLLGTAADDLDRWQAALHEGLTTLAARKGLGDDLAIWIAALRDDLGTRTLSQVVPDDAADAVVRGVVEGLRPVRVRWTHSEAFAAWWHDLHS